MLWARLNSLLCCRLISLHVELRQPVDRGEVRVGEIFMPSLKTLKIDSGYKVVTGIGESFDSNAYVMIMSLHGVCLSCCGVSIYCIPGSTSAYMEDAICFCSWSWVGDKGNFQENSIGIAICWSLSEGFSFLSGAAVDSLTSLTKLKLGHFCAISQLKSSSLKKLRAHCNIALGCLAFERPDDLPMLRALDLSLLVSHESGSVMDVSDHSGVAEHGRTFQIRKVSSTSSTFKSIC